MKTCYLIIFLFITSYIGAADSYGQQANSISDSITITGTVVDANDEPIINARVTLSTNDSVVAGAISDYDGKYIVKTPRTNNLALQIRYVGHKEYLESNITGNINNLLVILHKDPDVIEYEFRTITVPFFDKFERGHTKTLNSDEIEKGAY